MGWLSHIPLHAALPWSQGHLFNDYRKPVYPLICFWNSHWAETSTSMESRPMLNLPEPSEEERLGKGYWADCLPLAKCKCSFFSWQCVQGFFVKVFHVSSPTLVKKLYSGICARGPPGMLDKTWNRDYEHRRPILSPFCKAFFLQWLQ